MKTCDRCWKLEQVMPGRTQQARTNKVVGHKFCPPPPPPHPKRPTTVNIHLEKKGGKGRKGEKVVGR